MHVWLVLLRDLYRSAYIILLLLHYFKPNEPAFDKTSIRRATSEDSDQPAHPRSLIRVFADSICLLKPPGYPKRYKQEALPYWVDVQADLHLCWSHASYYRFCRSLGIEYNTIFFLMFRYTYTPVWLNAIFRNSIYTQTINTYNKTTIVMISFIYFEI